MTEAEQPKLDLEKQKLALEHQKVDNDYQLKLKEHDLKHRELSLKEKEVAIKGSEYRRAAWLNPFLIELLAAALVLLGNAIVALINGSQNRDHWFRVWLPRCFHPKRGRDPATRSG